MMRAGDAQRFRQRRDEFLDRLQLLPVVAVPIRAPAECSWAVQARDGCPQWNDTTGTPASHTASICAGSVNPVMKLTLNGRSVPSWIALIVWASTGAGIRPTPSEPRPPALLTATASSGVMPAKAIPACAIGV